MLAGNRIVGTRAGHAELPPRLREEADAELRCNLADLGVELALEKLRKQRGPLGNSIDEPRDVLGRQRLQVNRNLVGRVGAAMRNRLDPELRGVELHVVDAPRVVVGAPTGQPVLIIQMRECVDPLAFPTMSCRTVRVWPCLSSLMSSKFQSTKSS